MSTKCWKCGETINPTAHECAYCRIPVALANSPYATGYYDGYCDAGKDGKGHPPLPSFEKRKESLPGNGEGWELAAYEKAYMIAYEQHQEVLRSKPD